jgi:predicted RNA-binding protein with PIN domain
MLWYIIDGWNVIHKVQKLRGAHSPCEELMHYIRKHKLTGSINNRVTAIFDGRFDLPLEALGGGPFHIVFSGEKSADDVIKDKVARYKNKKQVVVVTDDREIRHSVKLRGVRCLSVKEFISKKKKKASPQEEKTIDYKTRTDITEELKKIWLRE